MELLLYGAAALLKRYLVGTLFCCDLSFLWTIFLGPHKASFSCFFGKKLNFLLKLFFLSEIFFQMNFFYYFFFLEFSNQNRLIRDVVSFYFYFKQNMHALHDKIIYNRK